MAIDMTKAHESSRKKKARRRKRLGKRGELKREKRATQRREKYV